MLRAVRDDLIGEPERVVLLLSDSIEASTPEP